MQAVAAGSAVLLAVAWFLEPRAVGALSLTLAVSSLVHLLLIAGEVTLPHGTAHAALAIREMTTGRYRTYFWLGLLGAAAGCATFWSGFEASLPLAILSLVGLGLYEHSYVQAGQAVPLA